MYNNVYLIFVNGIGTNNNKFYNMVANESDGTFTANWGRVGDSGTNTVYPLSKWHATIKSKVKKGYKDISDLKEMPTVISTDCKNKDFTSFYDVFREYAGSSVKKSYLIDKCSPLQMSEAQGILNSIVKLKNVDEINHNLQELYKVIPRRMGNVKSYLIENLKDLNNIIVKEQDALDSMDSNNALMVSNPFDNLNISFEKATTEEYQIIEKMFKNTIGYNKESIYKVFKSIHIERQKVFNDWVDKQNDQTTKLLIHGSRNANAFSILKSGLLIRPTNAVSFAGSAYNDGIYMSDSFTKSLNYTGYDKDKIFFMSICHQGNPYKYKGWYSDGKDISRSDMTYSGLKNKGYDSLHVNAGDGLLRDEFVFYKSEQVSINFIVWLR